MSRDEITKIESTSRPEVSVIIPTFNGGDILAQTLDAIKAGAADILYELICVDSGSTDGTIEAVRERGASVIEYGSATFNHGRARNLAARNAAGRYLVFISQDATPVGERWLARLIAPFDDPSVAGVYARQSPRTDASPLTKRQIENWVIGSDKSRRQEPLTEQEFDSLSPWDRYLRCNFDNVCSAIRRSVFLSIPFEETYFAEDLGWAKRALLSGHSIVYNAEAAVEHSHDRSFYYDFKRDYLCHRRLYALFGLRTVGRLRDAFRLSFLTAAGNARTLLVDLKSLDPRHYVGLLPAAAAAVFGQYLGAADETENRPLRKFASGV